MEPRKGKARNVKWSLTQLGWENPCCLRHPLLQSNPKEKFVVFASDYDATVSELEAWRSKAMELADVLKYAKGQLEHAGYTKNASSFVSESLAAFEKFRKEREG